MLEFKKHGVVSMGLKALLVCLYFLLMDGLWINFFATPLYAARLGSLLHMAEGPSLVFGLITAYGLLLAGLFFILHIPNFTVFHGIAFGLIVYGVFGWTNYLILKPWTLDLVFADWIWGGFLYGTSTWLAKWLLS